MCMKKQVGDTGSGEPLVLMIFVLILSNYIILRQTDILLWINVKMFKESNILASIN